jgi:phenylpyruvate tautomerase PptA (4-oxalocrotonate tautomerase family)
MPYIIVETISGAIGTEQKQKVVDAVIGVIAPMGVPADRINVIFNEHSPGDWAIGRKFQTDKSRMPVLINAWLSPERFFEKQKKAILATLTSTFVGIGFKPDCTAVCFQDMSFNKIANGGIFMWEIAEKHPPLK